MNANKLRSDTTKSGKPKFVSNLMLCLGESHQVGKISTFFARKTVPERFRSLLVDTRKGPMKVATIDDVVRWSHTGKRATERQPVLFEDFYEDDKTLVCPAGRGMCE